MTTHCGKESISKKRITSEFLQKMIDDYGCKCLNLNKAKVIGTLRLKYHSQLKNLDLSGCSAENQSVFEELLRSFDHLQKLSFTQKLNWLSNMAKLYKFWIAGKEIRAVLGGISIG